MQHFPPITALIKVDFINKRKNGKSIVTAVPNNKHGDIKASLLRDKINKQIESPSPKNAWCCLVQEKNKKQKAHGPHRSAEKKKSNQ